MDILSRNTGRRGKFRFAMERDLRYKLAEHGVVVASGAGTTTNMGSGGIAFVAEQPLTPGALVELSISWPVLLSNDCPMRIIVFGRVLRSTGCKVVCSVDKYEFRTQARTVQDATVARSDGMLQRWADGVRKESLKANTAGA